MAQPSVAQFFNTRKRCAVDDIFAAKSRKVLIVDQKSSKLAEPCIVPVYNAKTVEKVEPVKQTKLSARRRLLQVNGSTKSKSNELSNQRTLDNFMKKKDDAENPTEENVKIIEPEKIKKAEESKKVVNETLKDAKAPTKEVVELKSKAKKELNLEGVQQKLSRSEKLAELKASLFRFKQADARLKDAENKSKAVIENKEKPDVKKLKAFKSIELEVNLR